MKWKKLNRRMHAPVYVGKHASSTQNLAPCEWEVRTRPSGKSNAKKKKRWRRRGPRAFCTKLLTPCWPRSLGAPVWPRPSSAGGAALAPGCCTSTWARNPVVSAVSCIHISTRQTENQFILVPIFIQGALYPWTPSTHIHTYEKLRTREIQAASIHQEKTTSILPSKFTWNSSIVMLCSRYE